MKTTKLSVSVGIVAYNEERNIGIIISEVLRQKRTGWALNKLYVACGGCTDGTVETVRSMKNKEIVLIVNPKRQGKAVDEQKIFAACSSEILVMFDADVRLSGANVINDLIHTHTRRNPVNLVGGNARANAPHTFFERAVYTTFLSLDACRSLHGGNNIYGASGQCLALRKPLYKSILFPKGIIAEDDYIYFTNKKNNGGFRYAKAAKVYYNLPKTLPDYFRQTLRSDSASSVAHVERYFGSMVHAEYARPFSFYLNVVLKSFFANPIGTIFMMIVRIASRLVLPFSTKHYSIDWYTATSTK